MFLFIPIPQRPKAACQTAKQMQLYGLYSPHSDLNRYKHFYFSTIGYFEVSIISLCTFVKIKKRTFSVLFTTTLTTFVILQDVRYNYCFQYFLFLQPRKIKNVEHDIFKTKTARIHMQKQDLDTLQIRKMKGLKRHQKFAAEEDSEKDTTVKVTAKRTRSAND